ncbi:MAG: M16 family metallopeptidase [Thiotrichales bacterium]
MNKVKRIIAALGICLMPLGLTGQTVAAVPTVERMLGNGMKVIVRPDNRAPVAISQVWYRVGSSSEPNGYTGISHVLEHMMFKGTEAYPGGQFSEVIAANGGQENAFTSRDYTAYYQFLGNDRLEIAFKLEADRMRNLTLPKDEFARELEVVKEERLMRTDDEPTALTYEHFVATSYLNSPYQHPVIGWMTDLDHLEVDDLRHWYAHWYQPNNATLVVVGDVEPDAVFALADRYFGKIPAAESVPELKARVEVKQRGERRIKVKAPAKVPYLIVGYHVPVLNTVAADRVWEPYALKVLAGVLGDGSSSRLNRELVRGREIASSADASYGVSGKYSGQLLFDATPAQGRAVADLEPVLYEQIERVRETLVPESELNRIKAQVIARETYQLDSVQGQANQIGALESVGLGWRVLDEYAARIKAVTAEQVREVARKYLVEDNRTVAELVPLPIDETEPPKRPLKSDGRDRHG